MGTRAAVFAIYTGDDGYFATSPALNMQDATALAARLPLRTQRVIEENALNPWPAGKTAGIGVYARGAIVVHRSLLDECLRADAHPVTAELLRLFPGGTFIAFGLHSVVNYFGYTVIENGITRRRFGGAEDHIDADVGAPLPEEQVHFARSFVRDGMRYFKSPDFPDEEFDAPAYGEELVASLVVRLFGHPGSDADISPLSLLYFSRRPWWKIW